MPTTSDAPAPRYRDATAPIADRVTDLLSRMTVAEKVGLLFHSPFSFRFASSPEQPRAEALADIAQAVLDKHITHFNLRGSLRGATTPGVAASWLNEVQGIAARSRLGIPVTFSSDPRHGFANHPGLSVSSGYLSQWPEPIALAAIRDPALVRQFADTVRQEYRALGIHVALHPQADLATEPRWMRVAGTFGQDAELVGSLVTEYIRGMQTETLGPTSVACVTKHFPGGGPQRDGEDPHFPYGKDQSYSGGHFDYHLLPFEAAIAAGTSQLMPYYGRPVGIAAEEVGFAFNADIIATLLRQRLGFTGIVCSDWGILTDGTFEDTVVPAIAWGVEHLDLAGRMAKALRAGIDQFGGESCTEELVRLVEQGRITQERIDESARRLLAEKFRLGLFEQPFTDPARAEATCGRVDFRAAGRRAQHRAVTVLKNAATGYQLPLTPGLRCKVVGFDEAVAATFCQPDEDGEVVLIRIRAPYEPRSKGFERFYRAGRLDFSPEELRALLSLLDRPAVVAIELDRPAVIPELLESADAVLGFCGATDATLLDVIFGAASPEGRLPFDLPRSMAEVRAHPPDRPGGTPNPVLPYGWGLDLLKPSPPDGAN